MDCESTKTSSAESIDIPALRAKYRQERDKRMRRDHGEEFRSISTALVLAKGSPLVAACLTWRRSKC
jgi:hypothetical protein